MASPVEAQIQAAVEQLREDPGRTAILSDIDGTLAPITLRPDQTEVPARAREALRAVGERYGLVACITGRRAGEARELVGVDSITYSGNHGIETLPPGANETRFDLGLRAHLDAAAYFVERLDPGRLKEAELRLEDKGPIQALHWRGAGDEAAATEEAQAIAAAAEKAGLEPHWGRKVLELRPPGAGGKGAAVAALLAGGDFDIAAYAGDDRSDLDAFDALQDLNREAGPLRQVFRIGICSPEGPRELAARSDLALESTELWIELLERLAA